MITDKPRNKPGRPKRDQKDCNFVRVALTKEEFAIVCRAAQIDERCNSDFCRVYAMRYARVLCAQDDQQKMSIQGNQFMAEMAELQKSFSSDKIPDLPFKDC